MLKKKTGYSKLMSRKTNQDHASKGLSCALSWVFALVFFALIIFIVYASIPGFKEYGIQNILFTSTFDLANNKASIWLPLCVTILISLIAIIFAGPIGIKTAIFIKYRLPKKYKKVTRVGIELLADIPSVIFGLFAAESLGLIVKKIFNLDTTYSLLTAGIMLIFMILPTVVSLTLNALDGANNDLISASMVLGNTRTRSIYKVVKKEVRGSIYVGIIIALARAIGETMAVSMILQSQGFNDTFNQGFWGLLTSNLRTLGALISANMFAEGGGPALQGLLFAFGIFLFIFIMILNAVVMKISKQKSSKHKRYNQFTKRVWEWLLYVPSQIKRGLKKLFRIKEYDGKNISNYLYVRVKSNRLLTNFYTGWKMFWEWVSIIITLAFLFWILIDILGYGGVALASGYASAFSFGKDTTGQAFVNTLLIIVLAIGIGLPLSLLIAIYLNEFAKNGKTKKVLLFFIDSLGATPSILFGMFGLIFFIQTCGMSSAGSAGKSLIAGALTILIVILPTFIRTIQQALQSVPVELRTNSMALGAGKWETIRKIVLPTALQGITTSVVLSIGRILAETAPLYLTSGLSSSGSIALNTAGQTLTTRIYDQIYTADISQGTSVMYECAFITMILVLLIIMVSHVLIPYYFVWKQKRIKKKYSKPTSTSGENTKRKLFSKTSKNKNNNIVVNKIQLLHNYIQLI